LGGRKGTAVRDILAAIAVAFAEAGLATVALIAPASIEAKRDASGLLLEKRVIRSGGVSVTIATRA